MTTTTSTTTNGLDAPFNEEDTPFNGEEAFMDGLEKLAGILTGVAEKFDKLAGSFGGMEDETEDEAEEMDAGGIEDEAEEMSAGGTEDDAEEMDAGEAEDEAGYENVFGALKNLNLFAGNEQILAKFADPLVKALDSMSAILEDANEEIMDMIFDEESGADE